MKCMHLKFRLVYIVLNFRDGIESENILTVDCVRPCRLFGNSVERSKMAEGERVKS